MQSLFVSEQARNKDWFMMSKDVKAKLESRTTLT